MIQSDIKQQIIIPAVVGIAVTGSLTCRNIPAAGKSDSHARNTLFGAPFLSENIAVVHRRAAQLELADRYRFLRDHVLPSHSHNSIRLAAMLTQTNPSAPFIDDHSVDRMRLNVGRGRRQRRIETGGNLVSPAFDLIDAAQELNRLDELRAALDGCEADGEAQQRCRLALLAMIEMARGDDEAAGTWCDRLYDRFIAQRLSSLADRWPETLFVWRAVEQSRLLPEAESFLVAMVESQIRTNHCSGPAEWNRLIDSLRGRAQHASEQIGDAARQPYNSRPDFQHWRPVTRDHSWSSGRGIPPAHWQRNTPLVANLSSRDDEYLWYAIPFRGDFEFECECTGFGYRDGFPLVAGTWIAPVFYHDSFQIGSLLTTRPVVPLIPRLSQVDDAIHYRVEVQNLMCSRFINGRLVHQERLPANHSPWVAIRSPHYGRTHVRDARITGDPIVPAQLNLLECVALPGTDESDSADEHARNDTVAWPQDWMPWIQSPWNPKDTTWRLSDEQGTNVLIGTHRPALAGSGAERLFRYHWPLVFDAEIRYEFFYREGSRHVHPAIGRRAFLLEPDGVKTHWVTNGVSDSTGLDPFNRAIAAERQRLPLKPNSWNQAAVRLDGDRLSILLNGQLVFAGELHPANDRRFGVFHYCDRTEARVRNVVLKGNWPRTVPPLMNQEFRDPWSDELDRERRALPAVVEFDFRKMTLPEIVSRFHITYENARIPGIVGHQDDGLHVDTQTPATGVSVVRISPRVVVHGDFDIIAEFDNLTLIESTNGVAAIGLTADLRRQAETLTRVFRGVIQHPGIARREIMQGEFFDYDARARGHRWNGIFAQACRTGRLRISRRGRQVTLMLAESDSDAFRWIHSEALSDEPLPAGTIRLRSGGHSNGTRGIVVGVVWKKLDIRAQQIDDVLVRR